MFTRFHLRKHPRKGWSQNLYKMSTKNIRLHFPGKIGPKNFDKQILKKTRLSCFNVKTKLLWVKTSYFKLSKTRLLRSDYLGNLNLICLVSVCTKFQLPSMSRRGWKICRGGVSQVTTLPNLNSSFIELELGLGFDN